MTRMLLWVNLYSLFSKISLVDVTITSNRYVPHRTCGLRVLHQSTRYLVVDARNNLACAKFCSIDASCRSYNYFKDSSKCHLYTEVMESDCGNAASQPNVLYFEKAPKICYNGGMFNITTFTCDCINSYVGTQCKHLMTGCAEGSLYWYYSGQLGEFMVLPAGASVPIRIVCRMSWGGRTIVMQHYNPNVEYAMTWHEYKVGFVNHVDYTNWLSLDSLHSITKYTRYKIYIEIRNPDTNDYFLNGYDDFRIGNESTGYRLLSIGNQIANELDTCLTPDLIGLPFSTFDNDQDQNDTVNCAVVYGAGWWFHPQFCARCNPLGRIQMIPGGKWNGDPACAHWQGISWNPTTLKIWLEERHH